VSVNLTAGIVRILTSEGTTAGTGFVVTDDGLIATCAHIVEAAGAGPGGTVHVVFYATGEERGARVEPGWWRPADAEDVAILCLEGPLPKGVVPLPLGYSRGTSGHRLKAFGFPNARSQEGMWGYGTIGDLVSEETGQTLLQLTSATEITAGFSGAPVLDADSSLVVGMVTAITAPDRYRRLTETAFVIPSEVFVAICPDLERALYFPPYIGVSRPPEAIAVTPPLEADAQLDLEGRRYLVREVIAQRPFGALVVRTARASDLLMQRDVGLCQVEALTDAPETQASLRRVMVRAQTLGQVASGCGHIPQVYGVVKQRTDVVWVVVEWIRGALLDKLLPQDGPLPDGPALRQLLGWVADICDALSALHRRRVSHAGVSGHTVLVTRSPRGAVLIDPSFVDPPGPLTAEPPPFDPATDVRDLAATLYGVTTHHPSQVASASVFNPFVPAALDEVLRNALSGSIDRPASLRRSLRDIRRAL
jgi:hypothetical protein